MTSLRSCLSGFAASLAFLLAASSASADVVLNDTMSRPPRTAAPDATGAQWFRIGPDPGYSVTYATNDLKMTHSAGSGGQLLGYLTPAASPVNLAVGQSLKATFTFSLVGGFGASTPTSTDFRIGMFNTGAQRVSADVTTASANGKFTDYTGYAAMMSPRTTSGISLRRRIPSASSNKENLIGTTSTYTTLTSGSSQILQSNVNYTGVLTVIRSASGTNFRFSLSGNGLNSYELAYTDTSTSQVQRFDAIAFGWASNLMAANGGLAIRSLAVEVGNTEAVNPTDPVSNPDPGRPFIWVRNAEKSSILSKISTQPWAQSLRDKMIDRVASNVASHQSNRDVFFRGQLNAENKLIGDLPVDWTTGKYRTMTNTTDTYSVRSKSTSKFNAALDSAVLYYLTGETKYAQLAADVLHNVIKTLLPIAPSTDLGNGGWIIRNDLLLEARVLGTQMPIVYDFIRTFLETNKVYDVMTSSLTDFNYYQAQQYFRTYYQLVCDHGNNTNNWSALESTCMLNNLLALSDPAERAAALNIYLNPGTIRQASLQEDYAEYPQPGSIWPESLQYASAVSSIRSTHMVLLERYDPTLKLLDAYPNLPLSLSRISYLRYPNGEQISFGDGPRKTDGEPYFDYEVIYQHAKVRGRQDFVDHFGAAIKRGMDAGSHKRDVLQAYEDLGMHNEPVQLLWFSDDVTEAGVPQVLSTTDQVAHAGITLQRNLSPAGPLYGLMGFVGGAAHTHSHASGMSMELYGAGQVLGAKGGKSTYLSALHENYYRLFASNNTIIVNGASRGGPDGWEYIAINKVATAAVEPAVAQAPVSPNHSFTTSTFKDNKGTYKDAQGNIMGQDLTNANQQRTLGIIRTSPTTGYYVDIFRSDSALANEYHDYIYRNVGDGVTLETESGPLALTSATARFASDIGDTTGYQQPGWRYFTNTEVSAPTDAGVKANFSASLTAGMTQMRMHMPGSSGREYARVASPPIVEAPESYKSKDAPAVVIRKYGSAWDQPFAAVFEPHLGAAGSGSVKTVSKLERSGVVVGLQVGSTVNGRNLVQYVLSNPNATDVFTDSTRGLSFKGRYAVVTDNGDGSGSLYLGEGSSLSFKGNSVASVSGANTQAYVEFTAGQPPVVKSNQPVIVQTPPTITVPATATGTYAAAFGSIAVTATGQPAPTLSVSSALPPGLQFDAATGTLSGTPTAAGNYSVQFVATNAAGSASGTLALSIAKASAAVAPQNLEQIYTGQPLSPTAVTLPSNLPVVFSFAGSTLPTNAGSYTVTAIVNSPNYEGSATTTFVIRKAPATVTLQNLTQTYTGQPLSPTTSTVPAGLPVVFSYANNATHTDAGSYVVTATVNSPNYDGSVSGTLVINKAQASVTLQNLTQTYRGQPLSPTAVTDPANLPVVLAFTAGGTPTNAGSYAVTATVNSPNYDGSANGTLVINKALASVTLQNLTQTYTGQPLSPTAITVPGNLPVVFSYANNATHTDAGSYGVTATVNSLNYEGRASDTLVITKAQATVTLQNLTQTYTGQPLSPTATTVPADLPIVFTYANNAAHTDAGSYSVTATVNSPNYEGSASGTLVINKAQATITLANLDQRYDGTPRPVSATTNPAGLAVDLIYNGSPGVPVYPGDYAVAAAINDRNYQGTASAVLSVSITVLVRELPQVLGGIDGSAQLLASRDVTLSGNAWVSGDLLVPGTPNVQLQGRPVYGTTVQGSGAVDPSGYLVRLQGNAALRSAVLRIDPLTPTIPAAPPAPTGTQDLLLTSRNQQVRDFSTVRDLSLTGNAGEVAVPPGTYGKLSASGRTTLVLGVAGATTPAVYSLQAITLAGDSRLVLAGPVVLRVDNRAEFSGNAGLPAQPDLLCLEVHRGDVILDSRSVVGGTLIAPNAKISLRGQSELHGRLVAGELEIQSGAAVIDSRPRP